MKMNLSEVYLLLERNILEWAKLTSDIRAVILVGSRARTDHSFDEWSDIDLVVFSLNHDYYLNQDDWLTNIGQIWTSFCYVTPGGDPERLALFEGGAQVDFLFHPQETLQQMIINKVVPDGFNRGAKLLVDKDGVAFKLIPESFSPLQKSINEESFIQNVNMFWFASMYVVKQILRNELWVAKSRDANIKELLLCMIEWHSMAFRRNIDTWHAGKFIKEWAGDDINTELCRAFGQYNQEDSWNALITTINLFSRLSKDVADIHDFKYPLNLEMNVTNWIDLNKS